MSNRIKSVSIAPLPGSNAVVVGKTVVVNTGGEKLAAGWR